MNDKEKYGLNFFQAILLILLEVFTGKDWAPMEETSEPPPPPPLPSYVQPFVGLMNAQSWYAPSDRKAVYQVVNQVSVFFREPTQDTPVKRPDGTWTYKYVFELRTSAEQPILLNVEPGKKIFTYWKKIPTNTQVYSKAYADGGDKIEIVSPAGGVLRKFDDLKLLGYQESDGSWTSV